MMIEKNIKKILNKIDYNIFSKIAFMLLSIWILSPLLVMFVNIFSPRFHAMYILYKVLYVVGTIGLFIGFIYALKNVYKNNNYKKQFDYKKYLPITLLLILLLWCYFTCFTSINILRSFRGTLYRRDGFISYLLYFGMLLLGMMLKKEDKKNLLSELLIMEIIIATISLFNNNLTHILTYNQEAYDGIFCQFNHYGYYLLFGIVTSLFLFLTEKEKITYFLSYIMLLYTLVLNDTFGCFVAFTVTLFLIILYHIIYNKKNIKKLLPIVVSFILICCFASRNGNNVVLKNFNISIEDAKNIKEAIKEQDAEKIDSIGTTRGMLWRYAIKASIEKPITGYGIENIEQYYKINKIPTDRPHNVLIQFLAFTGLPGMLLYMSFIYIIVIRGFWKLKELDEISLLSYFMVICYIGSSMFGNSMFYTSPYYFIFLGILIPNLFYIKKRLKKTN